MLGWARWVRIATAAIVICCAIALDSAHAANALNWGSTGTAGVGGTTNGVWLTDSRFWYVAKRDLTNTYSAGVQSALTSEYMPTDLEVTIYVPTSCPDASYDLCVYDSNYGDNGYNGWNACAGTASGAHPNQLCSLDWVKINQHYSPPAKRIACHEMGHSIGLRHTGEHASCMMRSADGGTSEVLSGHDKGWINGKY